MKIVLIVEGKTEEVFLEPLRGFLQKRLREEMPRLSPDKRGGRIPTGAKLKRAVERHLAEGADAVIVLTDVYTGTREFTDAADAKKKMHDWVGPEARFYPHAALYDFEAWLIPYWEDIQRLSGSNRAKPSQNPETLNHTKPPAHRISEVFRTGTKRQYYVKPRDAKRILEGKDLTVAANQCCELKALLNTILFLCGGEQLG